MKRDNRLSGVLHVLLHMAGTKGPVTSDTLARMMRTNAVVVRRTLAGLREQGIVCSEKGHGGGWTFAADPDRVTLHDIYTALDSPTLFAIGNRGEQPTCLVEQAVNDVMNDALQDAGDLLMARFREVTLGELHRRLHDGASASGAWHTNHTA